MKMNNYEIFKQLNDILKDLTTNENKSGIQKLKTLISKFENTENFFRLKK